MATPPLEPIHNNAACEAVLAGTYQGTLVMCVGNAPYAVPLNHAFMDGKFTFHCGLHGRKIDILKQNPNVMYVVNKYHGAAGELPEDGRCHGPWESLLAYGTARIIEDPDEKTVAFRAFMGQYGQPDYTMSEKGRSDTAIIVIDVTSMTVRAELPAQEKAYWLWLPEGTNA